MPDPSPPRDAKTAGNMRRLSVVLFLVATSVVLATVVFPAGRHRDAIRVALVLVAGCIIGLAVLLSVAAAVNSITRRRRDASLADTTHSYTALGLALGLVIAVVVIAELMRGA